MTDLFFISTTALFATIAVLAIMDGRRTRRELRGEERIAGWLRDDLKQCRETNLLLHEQLMELRGH